MCVISFLFATDEQILTTKQQQQEKNRKTLHSMLSNWNMFIYILQRFRHVVRESIESYTNRRQRGRNVIYCSYLMHILCII